MIQFDQYFSDGLKPTIRIHWSCSTRFHGPLVKYLGTSGHFLAPKKKVACFGKSENGTPDLRKISSGEILSFWPDPTSQN